MQATVYFSSSRNIASSVAMFFNVSGARGRCIMGDSAIRELYESAALAAYPPSLNCYGVDTRTESGLSLEGSGLVVCVAAGIWCSSR